MKFYYRVSYFGIMTKAMNGIELDEKIQFLLNKGAKLEEINIEVIKS